MKNPVFTKPKSRWKRWLKWYLSIDLPSFSKTVQSVNANVKIWIDIFRAPAPSQSRQRSFKWQWIFSWPVLNHRASTGRSRRRHFLYLLNLFLPVRQMLVPKNSAMITCFVCLLIMFLGLFWLQEVSGLKRVDAQIRKVLGTQMVTVQQLDPHSPSEKRVGPNAVQGKTEQSQRVEDQAATKPEVLQKSPTVSSPEQAVSSYRKEVDVWLRVHGGNQAELRYAKNPAAFRVTIEKIQSNVPYNVQLNFSSLSVKANSHYVVRFRARADHPREIYLGFARSGTAWYGLGLYQRIELTSDWQEFLEEFWPTEDADNARIHFDLGESPVGVEFSAIQLASASESDLPEN